MASWEAVTALGTLGASIITGSVAYGRLRQKVADMGKQLTISAAKIDDYDKRLYKGDSDLKLISQKIDNLLTNQSDMKEQIGKMDDRLRRHCEDG